MNVRPRRSAILSGVVKIPLRSELRIIRGCGNPYDVVWLGVQDCRILPVRAEGSLNGKSSSKMYDLQSRDASEFSRNFTLYYRMRD
jgi:hypothetical protein